ncbi:hypothetical protein EXN66_Car016664 [Channa argus]|uniref:Uncharacterized protein n=1 Tax=Channa argus TaxID=215402 RepID=A0A6G1QFT0_CHAAH|nr:hypothetical protein EXN66_Car016664 [Channa argus]
MEDRISGLCLGQKMTYKSILCNTWQQVLCLICYDAKVASNKGLQAPDSVENFDVLQASAMVTNTCTAKWKGNVEWENSTRASVITN